MLYAVGHPVALVGLVLGFVLAVTAHAYAQALVATRLGERRPRAEGRVSLDPRRQLDPFGALAAALAGPGWCRPVEAGAGTFRGRKWKPLVALAAGPIVSGVLGCGLLLGARAAGAPGAVLGVAGLTDLSDMLHGRVPATGIAARALLGAGAAALAVALVSLVPIPPLDGGRALFAVAPHSLGWQRARHWLIEQNIGLVAVLALLVIPISGERPLLLVLLDTVARPLLHQIGSL